MGGGTIKGVSDNLEDETRNTISLRFRNQFPWRLTSACSFGDNGFARQPGPRRGGDILQYGVTSTLSGT